MIGMTLSEAAGVLGAEQIGEDVHFAGLSTDTRSLRQGNLFVALQGPSFDGHDYVGQADARGAAAAAVSRPVGGSLPLLRVADTRLALGALAADWRRRFDIPVVAITGSNGKTTVKEMVAAILHRSGRPLVTAGNFNNDIGLPLTLGRLGPEHDYAVLELGANHPGEIAALAAIAAPGIGLVNNAAPAHLEGFGDLEGVARAKGELFERLPADGVAVINADDRFAPLWRQLAGARRVISFGLEKEADVGGRWRSEAGGSRVELCTPAGEAALRLQLAGRHNVMNALAAAAVATALGVTPAQIAAGLAALVPVDGRLQPQPGLRGLHLIDDTYNANPASLQAALEVLAGAAGERWLVLGDMGELGADSARLHRAAGEAARAAGIERLWTLGELAALAAPAFGSGAQAFEDSHALVAALQEAAGPGVTALVKGSRRMRMERVVQALADTRAQVGEGC